MSLEDRIYPTHDSLDGGQSRRSPSQRGQAAEWLEMPPKLFTLRDLHASKARAEMPAASQAGGSCDTKLESELAQTTAELGRMCAVASGGAIASDTEGTHAGGLVMESDPGETTHPDINSSTSQRQLETGSESSNSPAKDHKSPSSFGGIPAGRDWAESILAHRKALVLLVVVIAIAFWTGYRKPTSQADPLAQDDVLLDVSDGMLVDANLDRPMVSPSNGSPDPMSATIQSFGSIPVAELNTPSPPAPPEVAQTATALGSISPATATAQSNGVEVMTVSSQTPHRPQIQTPGLNDFQPINQAAMDDFGSNEFSALNPHSSTVPSSGIQPSSTPFGPDDWLKYLPPVTPAN